MLIKTDFETKPLHPSSLESEDVCEESTLSALIETGYATKLNKWVKKNLYTYFDYDEITLLLLGRNEFYHAEFERKWLCIVSVMLEKFIDTYKLSADEIYTDTLKTFTYLQLLKVSIANVLYRDENVDIISPIESICSTTECDDE